MKTFILESVPDYGFLYYDVHFKDVNYCVSTSRLAQDSLISIVIVLEISQPSFEPWNYLSSNAPFHC